MSKRLILSDEIVASNIRLIRGQKVILDRDLAVLYDVKTRDLNKAVSRNKKRFPDDFMFQLTHKEFENLMFQNGTSSWGGTRKMPYAFTEQGVAMLSSVLNSERSILVNIYIVRVFTKMRRIMVIHKDVLLKLKQLEGKVLQQDDEIKVIFRYLKELINPKTKPVRKIGFKHKV